MKKKKRKKRAPRRSRNRRQVVPSSENILQYHSDIIEFRNHIQEFQKAAEHWDDKIQDIEIHLNLLTRLLTTLCVEKFGMRIGVLKRLIKRIEKEAIRDSQILHLETLYKMPPATEKKGPLHPPAKNDPWEDIS